MAIIRFDENGNYISIYRTLTEVKKKTKQDIGNVSKCVHGILDKTNNNYYIEVENPTTSIIEKIHKIVSGYVEIVKIGELVNKLKSDRMSNLVNELLDKDESQIENHFTEELRKIHEILDSFKLEKETVKE
jgi:PBP1b-binding outer membrane lipoprotein LpoB